MLWKTPENEGFRAKSGLLMKAYKAYKSMPCRHIRGVVSGGGKEIHKTCKFLVDSRTGSGLYTPHQRGRHAAGGAEVRPCWRNHREPRERHSTGPGADQAEGPDVASVTSDL
jgi:hypothetical protein